MTAEEISTKTGVPSRKVYDILNTLTTTPLVRKIKCGSRTVFTFGDGSKLNETNDICFLLFDIESEQRRIL